MDDTCGIVHMTAPTRSEAEAIAEALVRARLAACVQVMGDIRSRYWWDGRMHDESEVMLCAKTTAALFPRLAATVTGMHSYAVPEIVFVPITLATPQYLAWIRDVTDG